MKKIYIIPELNITKLTVENMVAASPLSSVSGLDGVSKGQGDFTGGAADVKSNDVYNVWDDAWSR